MTWPSGCEAAGASTTKSARTRPADRLPVLPRDRRFEAQAPRELAARPTASRPTPRSTPRRIRKPSPSSSAVSGSRRAAPAVHQREDPLAAAVGHLEEQRAAAARRVLRLDHVEVRGELDFALGVARREREVDDRAVARVVGQTAKNIAPETFSYAPRARTPPLHEDLRPPTQVTRAGSGASHGRRATARRRDPRHLLSHGAPSQNPAATRLAERLAGRRTAIPAAGALRAV